MPVHPTPTLLLTRPRASAERFAEGIEGAQIVIAPLMEIVGTGAEVPLEGAAALILTSESAVRFLPKSDLPAYCVGPRTAKAAEDAGFRAEMLGPDADGLVAGLIERAPGGLLVHCHGTHTRGDVARRLTQGGLTAQGVAVYDQVARPPDAAFRAAIIAPQLVIPLFSPRSAELFVAAAGTLRPDAQLITLSQAVTDTLPSQWQSQTRTLPHPSGEEMRSAVQAALLRRNSP
ncbi:uroporphyrinogen-III synthase [Hasllibacter sp. MH4015]|uniref:uroporphyrinogen-III synthase n=1 Tax=Hasllibacter sp. MH4015 TaxID=2854029 RepID=UPI001CD37CB5|nr:uroporphyrinogen-III synthase [Hasllibacter sp. MH4015]